MMNDQKKEILEFPALFPIKVMGLARASLQRELHALCHAHCDDFDETKTKCEYSRSKKYVSITVIVNAQSREQLDALYQSFVDHPLVKFVL